MITREGYETYLLYLALQRHFSTTYDFYKYNGKVNASKEAYSKRKDFFSFEKLSKIIPKEKRFDFFVSHFLENPKEWIRNMDVNKLKEFESKWKRIKTTFKEDLQTIKNYGPAKCLSVGNDIPLIHKLAINKEISLETIIILDSYIFPFIENHEEKVSVPFVWPDHIKKCKKYRQITISKIDEDKDLFVDIAKTVLH